MTAATDRMAWRRLAVELERAGLQRSALAAAVLVCRGRLRLDVASFARFVGLEPAHVAALEAGQRPAFTVPRRLLRLAPDLDWTAAGVLLGAGDPAARHPAARGARPRGGTPRAGRPP